MGELRITDPYLGDNQIEFDPDKKRSMDKARKLFDDYISGKAKRGKKFIAYAIMKGKPGRKITTFDPTADRIVMVPPVQGG